MHLYGEEAYRTVYVHLGEPQWDHVDLIVRDYEQVMPIIIDETEYRPWLDGEYTAYDDFAIQKHKNNQQY